MLKYLWWIVFAFSIFLMFFASFKCSQRGGSRRLNDAMTRVGEGSFATGIKHLVLQGLWLVISLTSMFGIYYSYKLATSVGEVETQPVVEQQIPKVIIEQKSAPTSQPTPNSVPTQNLDQEKESPTPQDTKDLYKG